MVNMPPARRSARLIKPKLKENDMSQDNLTFEYVNDHIEKADLEALEAAGPEGVIDKICPAYAVVRPILKLIAGLPIIPAKWKKALKLFMQFMDAFCPQD